MYLAKDQGKGRYAIFEPGMHAAAIERLQLKSDLQRAVRDGELSLVYQPIVDLRRRDDRRRRGARALGAPGRAARCPPGEFIPLAEETGLIVELGRAAAARGLPARRGPAGGVPAADAADDVGEPVRAPAAVARARRRTCATRCEASGIAPSSLVLELTESAMIEDVELAIAPARGAPRARRVARHRRLRHGLLLAHLPPALPRRRAQDRPLVHRRRRRRVGGDAGADRLDPPARRRSSRLKPVAEGIEDAAQLERLRELGCTLGQGFHLHRPLSAAATVELMRADGRSAAAAVG